jgi:hypothetical protein
MPQRACWLVPLHRCHKSPPAHAVCSFVCLSVDPIAPLGTQLCITSNATYEVGLGQKTVNANGTTCQSLLDKYGDSMTLAQLEYYNPGTLC